MHLVYLLSRLWFALLILCTSCACRSCPLLSLDSQMGIVLFLCCLLILICQNLFGNCWLKFFTQSHKWYSNDRTVSTHFSPFTIFNVDMWQKNMFWLRANMICSATKLLNFKGHCGWMFIPVHVWSSWLLGDWKILSWPVHMLTQQRIQCKYLETSRSCAVKKLQKILIFLKSSVMFLSKNYFWK